MSNGTPTRILETAWTLMLERGPRAVTIGEIATAAGVSRQLVYHHFANRAGLLIAMARHQDERSGFVDSVRAARKAPPVAGLEALVRAWLEYVPSIVPVAEALEAALITGEDGAGAWRDRMGELREAFGIAVDRVERDGALAPGWTVEAAADWAWARCQPSTRRHLVGERSWKPDDYVARTVRSILDEILKPGQGNV